MFVVCYLVVGSVACFGLVVGFRCFVVFVWLCCNVGAVLLCGGFVILVIETAGYYGDCVWMLGGFVSVLMGCGDLWFVG